MTRIFIRVLQAGQREYVLYNKPVFIRMLTGKINSNKGNRPNHIPFKDKFQHAYLSCYSALCKGIKEESILHDDDIEDWKLSSERLRSFLYPNSEDEIIKKLNSCITIQQVFDIIDENKKALNHEHSSQALCVLWDLKKLCERANFTEDIANEVTLCHLFKEIKDFTQQITSHESFKTLFNCIKNNYNAMTIDALSITLLHLHKLDIPLRHAVMQSIIMRLEESLGSVEPKDFPLTALSRFSVTLSDSSELWAIILSVKLIPHIIYHIGMYIKQSGLFCRIHCTSLIVYYFW